MGKVVSFAKPEDALEFFLKSGVGREVEERFDPDLRRHFRELSKNYLLEIVAPGTRTEVDFRVQIDIYKKGKARRDGSFTVKKIGYVKVDEHRLESLAVPAFFVKIGKEVYENVKRREGK